MINMFNVYHSSTIKVESRNHAADNDDGDDDGNDGDGDDC